MGNSERPEFPSIPRKACWLALAGALLVAGPSAHGGGPKYVAGVSYFNPGVVGQPIVWSGGQVTYFMDQGPLTASISNAQATAMVDAAAAVWNAAPAAAVQLTDGGNLAEVVDQANIQASNGVFVSPTDLAPSATATPVGVVFDQTGAAIDALFGTGASDPGNCSRNGVFFWLDNFQRNASLAHGVIVLNGLCATSPMLLTMMSYQLERAFGRILGLDFAQVNDNALVAQITEPNAALAWPIMDPVNGTCGAAGGVCVPNPGELHADDVAALNRLYPVTAANLSAFPTKLLTAPNTLSIQGTIRFPDGTGMQGVNVVARPLDANGNPMFAYTVTAVSGALFAGNRGNPVTGFLDSEGNRLDRYGTDDPALQGFFDLSGIALPPGLSSATYQITFEAMNPEYFDDQSVGPYLLGSPSPSGFLPALRLPGMQAGSAQTVSLTAAIAARELIPQGIGTEVHPEPIPGDGVWLSRLGRVNQTDWLALPVRGNRIFTVVAQALNEAGSPSASKAMPAIGVWDGFDLGGTPAAGATGALNGLATGETWLQVATAAPEAVRIGITDQRGDGRPDYVYRGWVLYADTVDPPRLPTSGGAMMIRGVGFRSEDTVTVGGASAQITAVTPTEISAVVPPAATGVMGSQDVTVSDRANLTAVAIIPGGVSYDAAVGDGLSIVAAPMNQLPQNVPAAFIVRAVGADGNPAGGVTVMFLVTTGSATLGCGNLVCVVPASGDGLASLAVTPTSREVAVVTASLTNGASVQTQFTGGTPPALAALTPTLFSAAGATVSWPVQALVQSGATPTAGQSVTWQSSTGLTAPTGAIISDANGLASATLVVGPLAEGQSITSNACLAGSTICAAFRAFGSRPEFAALTAVSGTRQSLATGTAPATVILRLRDANGNAMAGGSIHVSQTLYSWMPPCPRQGRCAQAPVLARKTMTLTSALDGTVVVIPLNLPGVATTLNGLATTGDAGMIHFSVEELP